MFIIRILYCFIACFIKKLQLSYWYWNPNLTLFGKSLFRFIEERFYIGRERPVRTAESLSVMLRGFFVITQYYEERISRISLFKTCGHNGGGTAAHKQWHLWQLGELCRRKHTRQTHICTVYIPYRLVGADVPDD